MKIETQYAEHKTILMNVHTIELYWESFYDLMEELGIPDDYHGFEQRIHHALETEFPEKKFEIEWCD